MRVGKKIKFILSGISTEGCTMVSCGWSPCSNATIRTKVKQKNGNSFLVLLNDPF